MYIGMLQRRSLWRLFLFFAVINTVCGSKDSSVYFPIDDSYPESSQSYKNGHAVVKQGGDLESLRGTRIYEKYVEDIIARGIGKLTVAVNKLLTSQSRNQENVLFSPISISSALALVFLGSNGITFKEISELWGLQTGIPDIAQKSGIVHEQFSRMLSKLNETTGFHLSQEANLGTAIFVQQGYPIRPIYESTAQELYGSAVVNLDFQSHPDEAKYFINNWVAERTNNKIKNIISEGLSRETKVIIASALYFKAKWEHPFFAGGTSRRPFYINGRKTESNVRVDMMSNGGEFPYYKDSVLGCEILGLPYKGGKSTMYIIMPFNSTKERLHEFESKVTEKDLNDLVGKTRTTGVILIFPKMKIETTIDLKETLKLLGVTSLFDPNKANLALLSPGDIQTRSHSQNNSFGTPARSIVTNRTSTIKNRIGGVTETIDNIRQQINQQSTDNNFQNPGLYADKIIHKVFMDINEVGTEAAAATSVILTKDGSRVRFRVDVPFSFFIRHEETSTILFWGSIVIPYPSFANL